MSQIGQAIFKNVKLLNNVTHDIFKILLYKNG